MATQKTRQKVVQAFMELFGEEGWEAATLARTAARAGVSLSVMRAEFPSRLSILEEQLSRIDRAVLDSADSEMAEEPARDRLFDVLMNRLDQMKPHKAAVRALKEAVRSDPFLALEVNRLAGTSMRWMLIAAGIDARGIRGRIMVQGLVIAFARLVDVWLDDEDAGLARTMAALDRELERGAEWLGRLDRLEKMAGRLRRAAMGAGRRRRASMQKHNDDEEIAEGAGI